MGLLWREKHLDVLRIVRQRRWSAGLLQKLLLIQIKRQGRHEYLHILQLWPSPNTGRRYFIWAQVRGMWKVSVFLCRLRRRFLWVMWICFRESKTVAISTQIHVRIYLQKSSSELRRHLLPFKRHRLWFEISKAWTLLNKFHGYPEKNT